MAEVRKALGTTEGSRMPPSKAIAEDRLGQIPGVVATSVEAACCQDSKAILYVGIEEKGAPTFALHTGEFEELALPESVTKAYFEFVGVLADAGRSGGVSEDLSQGHSLSSDAKVRYLQLGFVGIAEENLAILRNVLRKAADPEQRAIAAYVIGYAKDKTSVHDDLQYALRDPDSTVRANALRALAAFAVYAQKNPESGLRVSPTWMVEMLNSVVWTDRNNAAVALVTLTDGRDAKVLETLRERALTPLIEMARWKHLPHALPAYILTGRISGIAEAELQELWKQEQREAVIKRALRRK
jgi:hypothetical protein